MNIQSASTPTCSTEAENSHQTLCRLQTLDVAAFTSTGHTVKKKKKKRKNLLFTADKKQFSELYMSWWNVKYEFWEEMGAEDRQRPLLTRKETMSCQSCHSSVNSCLILCWKLPGPGSRGRQEVKAHVNDAPPLHCSSFSIIEALVGWKVRTTIISFFLPHRNRNTDDFLTIDHPLLPCHVMTM